MTQKRSMTAKTILYLNGANKIIQTKCLIYTVQQKDLYRATKTIDGKIENNAARGEAVCKSHVCIHVYIVLKCVCVCVCLGGRVAGTGPHLYAWLPRTRCSKATACLRHLPGLGFRV